MEKLLNARVMLFTPANRLERFEKAKELGADGVVIDLEDAISLGEKDQARNTIINYFKETKPTAGFLRCLRINSIKTPAGLKDITAIIEHGLLPDILVIPKTEYAAEIAILDALIQHGKISYIGLIETALGLDNAVDIACSSENLKAICLGGADLASDLGARLAWEPMLNARSRVVSAAAIAGIVAFDMPYLNLHDTNENLLLEETERVKALGFSGKFSIHPKQIKPILSVFTPTADEVAHAKRILEAYEKEKGNVCILDGKMIDVPIVRSAKRILSNTKPGS